MSFLNTIPKRLLVVLSITLGVIFIVLQDPPKTICDVQKEVFLENNQNFLFKNPKNKIKTKTVFEENIEDCTKTNTIGGCYSLFYDIPKIIDSFRAIEEKCHSSIATLKEVQQALFKSYALFLEISWGQGPINELSNPLAWLSSNDISIYCHLKTQIIRLYGVQALEQLEIDTLKEIAPDQSTENHRRFSILSENCLKYP